MAIYQLSHLTSVFGVHLIYHPYRTHVEYSWSLLSHYVFDTLWPRMHWFEAILATNHDLFIDAYIWVTRPRWIKRCRRGPGLSRGKTGQHKWLTIPQRRVSPNHSHSFDYIRKVPDSKVHGTNMGPIWGRQDPGGPPCWPHELCLPWKIDFNYIDFWITITLLTL